jgi:hypothetical protein
VNTIAASSRRIPRPAVIGLVALVVAFAALMLVRSGVLGGSSNEPSAVSTPTPVVPVTPATPAPTTPVKPKVELLPGLPSVVASKLHFSKVVVITLYTGTAPGDRAAVAQSRAGARSVGAGFAAVNVLDEKQARAIQSFGGPADSPSVLVVRRPGKIVAQFDGVVDSRIVAQAARNAGARRR